MKHVVSIFVVVVLFYLDFFFISFCFLFLFSLFAVILFVFGSLSCFFFCHLLSDFCHTKAICNSCLAGVHFRHKKIKKIILTVPPPPPPIFFFFFLNAPHCPLFSLSLSEHKVIPVSTHCPDSIRKPTCKGDTRWVSYFHD